VHIAESLLKAMRSQHGALGSHFTRQARSLRGGCGGKPGVKTRRALRQMGPRLGRHARGRLGLAVQAAAAAEHRVGQEHVATDDVLHGHGVAADDQGAGGCRHVDRRLGPALQQLTVGACRGAARGRRRARARA
jgi:hypothetical protein